MRLNRLRFAGIALLLGPAPAPLAACGDPQRGRQAIARYGCGCCHIIPGIEGATARVGPQLTDLRHRTYIAGRLPNVPHNVAAWIHDPQQFEPGVAMPNLGVSDTEARDIAAYLYQSQ